MLGLSMACLVNIICSGMLLALGKRQNASFWVTLLMLSTLSLFALLAFG